VIISSARILLKTAKAVDQVVVRIANERAVLTLVALNPGLSAAELARRTQLGPQTVGKIVADFEARGMITGGEVIRGMRGQPPTPLYLSPTGSFAIGCEIGWRHCIVELISIAGEVLGHHRWDYAFPNAHTIFKEVASVVDLLLRVLPEADRGRLLGVAVAAPALTTEMIEQLGGQHRDAEAWQDLDVRQAVEAATGHRTVLFNDGLCACWAELAARPSPRPGSMSSIFIDSAVQSGVVADGRLIEGSNGNAADLGMTLVTGMDGKTECVNAIAGIHALRARLAAAGIDPSPNAPADWNWEAMEPVVGDWLDAGGRAVAFALANANAIVDSRAAILGGAMPPAIVERYLASVRHHLELLPLPASRRVTLLLGQVGESAAAKGAGMLFLFRHFFAGEWEYFDF
jgi:predicted NBD/HSP70 family sugar kinase